jgi:hypothetical protein
MNLIYNPPQARMLNVLGGQIMKRVRKPEASKPKYHPPQLEVHAHWSLLTAQIGSFPTKILPSEDSK